MKTTLKLISRKKFAKKLNTYLKNYFDINLSQVQSKLIEDQREISRELKAFQEFSKVLSKGKIRAEDEFETLSKELNNLKEHQMLKREQLYDALERTHPEDYLLPKGINQRSQNVLKPISNWDSNEYFSQKDGPVYVSQKHEGMKSGRVNLGEIKSKKIKDLINDIEDILDR